MENTTQIRMTVWTGLMAVYIRHHRTSHHSHPPLPTIFLYSTEFSGSQTVKYTALLLEFEA